MKLACITGIDGTGKTTLARSVTEALRERGVPASCIYGRTYPILSRLLMTMGQRTVLRKRNMWTDYRSYAVSKRRVMRNPWLARIYSAAVLLDYYPQIWLKLLPHLLTRRVVVCDRYLYDTVIGDLAVHLNYSAETTDRAIELGMRFLPKPNLVVLLDVPPEVALARKDDVPHIDYLVERRRWYLRLKKQPDILAFNGETSPAVLVRTLVEKVVHL